MISMSAVVNAVIGGIIKVYAGAPNKDTGMSNTTKLHQALKANEVRTVRALVTRGVNVNMVYQQETAFTRALECRHFECATIIMESANFDPNAGNQFDRTPLFMASKLNRSDFLRRLLSMGARVNDADIRGVTPLGACAWHDSYDCAEILVEHGANVDQPDVVGQTPLYRACSNVSKNVVGILLKQSCDVNLPTCDRKTPLMAALPSINQSCGGKTLGDIISVCNMLVDQGCDVNAQDENGKTALHYAVEDNDVHGLCFLAEHGCDLEVEDSSGYTAFQTAILARRPRYELARYLLYFGADARKPMLNPNEQDRPLIRPLNLLLTYKPNRAMDLNTKWSRTMLLTTLSCAVYPHEINIPFHTTVTPEQSEDINSHDQVELDIVEWLNQGHPCSLEHQARLIIREAVGGKHALPKIDSLPVGTALKRFLNLGLNSRTLSLDTVCQLHGAIKDRDNVMVEKLLNERTDTSMPLNNRNALALSIEVGNEIAASMIIRNGGLTLTGNGNASRPSVMSPSHDSALHLAAKHGRMEVMKELLALNVDVSGKNSLGATPLQEAAIAGKFEAAALLIQRGADVAVFGHGMPILHLAAASGATQVVELLLGRGCDVDSLDVFGNTPLHVAASKGSEYLLRHISLPSLYHDEGSEALDAIQMMMTDSAPAFTKKESGHVATVNALLALGADVTIVNSQSKTPLGTAEDSEDAEIIRILKIASPPSDE